MAPHRPRRQRTRTGGTTISETASKIRDVVRETQDYYDGPADEIYRLLWQDNVHMGTWESGVRTLQEAMDLTNQRMAEAAGIDSRHRVLDVGCGYGETAFHLAREYGCEVVGTNISEKELELARERTPDSGVADKVSFEYGDFHELPFEEGAFDVIWSQEAFLHGVDKPGILRECFRVLAPGGRLVISDLLMSPDVDPDERERIHARVHSPQMWSFDRYVEGLRDAGFEVDVQRRWDANVPPTYQAVLDGLLDNRDELEHRGVSSEQLDSTAQALQLWVDSGKAGKIGQGLFVGRRP